MEMEFFHHHALPLSNQPAQVQSPRPSTTSSQDQSFSVGGTEFAFPNPAIVTEVS